MMRRGQEQAHMAQELLLIHLKSKVRQLSTVHGDYELRAVTFLECRVRKNVCIVRAVNFQLLEVFNQTLDHHIPGPLER